MIASRLTKEGELKKRKNEAKRRGKHTQSEAKKVDDKVQIMGVVINSTQRDRLLKRIWLQRKEMLHIATVNSEFVMEARTNPEFAQALSNCATVADGWGVVWANRILSRKGSNEHAGQLERITGGELTEVMIRHAAERGEKVFLLGASEGVAKQAAVKMSTKYPTLQITAYEGARNVREEKFEEGSLTIAKINSISPDYLLVAYGSPWQDIWIERNRPYLRVRVAIGVGGVLDEWAGKVAVCPNWIDKLGFKWLWRLTHEPWRWKRIVKVIQFAFLVLKMKLK